MRFVFAGSLRSSSLYSSSGESYVCGMRQPKPRNPGLRPACCACFGFVLVPLGVADTVEADCSALRFLDLVDEGKLVGDSALVAELRQGPRFLFRGLASADEVPDGADLPFGCGLASACGEVCSGTASSTFAALLDCAPESGVAGTMA
jgi:hypothetical protein